MAARDPATPPVPEPPAGSPEKLSQHAPAAGTPIIETAAPTIDRRTGEPVSAEVRPERAPREGVMDVLVDSLRSGPAPAPLGLGTLPATARVLASGRTVETVEPVEDTATRFFTAAIRIMRDVTLYEAGAPVPLTRIEFEAKTLARAIEERFWDQGISVVA